MFEATSINEYSGKSANIDCINVKYDRIEIPLIPIASNTPDSAKHSGFKKNPDCLKESGLFEFIAIKKQSGSFAIVVGASASDAVFPCFRRQIATGWRFRPRVLSSSCAPDGARRSHPVASMQAIRFAEGSCP